MSEAALDIQQGSLYPSLHRLERKGWLKSRWRTTDNNRKAKYYELTTRGRANLELELESWRRLTLAVNLVLGST